MPADESPDSSPPPPLPASASASSTDNTTSSSSFPSASPYPFAAAPDIIRAHQKDAYFQGVLTGQLADLHRRLLGARSAHAWAAESGTAADLLYLSLTTLLGNRTLGEEYCDLVQVEAGPAPSSPGAISGRAAARLPSLARRAAYISASVLAPYMASRVLPRCRSALRARLEARLAELTRRGKGTTTPAGKTGATTSSSSSSSWEYRIERYVLAHLGTLTSGAPVQAVVLAVFYFTGAYYSLAKRLTGLRYVFTRRLEEEGQEGGGTERAGYEVLGVLLAVQLAVQAWLHVRATLRPAAHPAGVELGVEAAIRERAGIVPPRDASDVSLDGMAYSANNELLLSAGAGAGGASRRIDIAAATRTPVPAGGRPRYDLADGKAMAWISGRQQRKCTLCLEELRDPAATQCGHVFCWACIGDWVREKPECPLCRREALAQHILPLRAL